MEFIFIFLTTVVISLLTWLCMSHIRSRKQYLESLGFPIEPPFFIFGSPPFAFHKLRLHEVIQAQHRKFGKTWTRYLGASPNIVTIDPDLIGCIVAKNFDHFTDSNSLEMPDEKTTLDISKGEVWRALRKRLSPTFSSGKLKSMVEPMEQVADCLLTQLEKKVKVNPVLECRAIYQAYALDTIARCAFGIETNAQAAESDHEVLVNGRQLFTVLISKNWFMTLFLQLIIHVPGILKFVALFPKAFDRLYDITQQIIDERRKTNAPVVGDFIDRLKDIIDAGLEAPLNEKIIYAQGVVFFAAGFETTSSTLTSFSFHLAKYPDIQEKIFREVEAVMNAHNGKIDHETIKEMPYLEAAIMENLRLCPPVTDSMRYCTQDFEHNGIKIKKGTAMTMPIWVSHMYEEFFPEPEVFRPERFLKENADQIRPNTYRPFGAGNRQCIGQRFAMTEMKVCIAKVISKYRLEPTPETTSIEFSKGSLPFLHYGQVWVKFVPR